MTSFDRLVASGLIDRVEYFEELVSTNTTALDWVRSGRYGQYGRYRQGGSYGSGVLNGESETERGTNLPERLLIIAGRQTGGRGQFQRVWWSSERSLLLSLILPWRLFSCDRRASAELSQRVAEAVRLSVVSFLTTAGVDLSGLRVKLPNDLYYGERKLAGILVESPNPQTFILGLGLNLNNRREEYPEELSAHVLSLWELTGRETDPVDFLEVFLPLLFGTNLRK